MQLIVSKAATVYTQAKGKPEAGVMSHSFKKSCFVHPCAIIPHMICQHKYLRYNSVSRPDHCNIIQHLNQQEGSYML